MATTANEDEQKLASLTAKQREVLDLLIDHKTSKEIARALQISPHTVNQRIEYSKRKLGAASRAELAVEYRRLIATYESLAYESFHLPSSALSGKSAPQDDSGAEQTDRQVNDLAGDASGEVVPPNIVPKVFKGRSGKVNRVLAITGVTAFVLLAVSGLAAIMWMLSSMPVAQ